MCGVFNASISGRNIPQYAYDSSSNSWYVPLCLLLVRCCLMPRCRTSTQSNEQIGVGSKAVLQVERCALLS